MQRNVDTIFLEMLSPQTLPKDRGVLVFLGSGIMDSGTLAVQRIYKSMLENLWHVKT